MIGMIAFALLNGGYIVAQDTRESAVAHMRSVKPSEMDPSFTTAAPAAQKLLEEVLAKHPEVILVAMHVTPPGSEKNVIIASNFGRIGKLGDEDDMRVVNTGKSNLGVEPAGNHFEAELTLQDKAGSSIGALGIVFNYKTGDDTNALTKLAQRIRDELKLQISTKASLFVAI
ncbi:MAG: hypothetical protein M3O31_02775 [Acidobacteriota bacterium]|nr:hypothetical protein [Acidobacteriota bacterium]